MSVNASETLKAVHCWKCGILYALPDAYLDCRHEDGRTFWCPNGHAGHYTPAAETAAAESAAVLALRQQLAQALHRAEQAEARAEELASGDARAVKDHSVPPPLPADVPLACPECGREYKAGSGLCLLKHLTQRHGMTRDAACTIVNDLRDGVGKGAACRAVTPANRES